MHSALSVYDIIYKVIDLKKIIKITLYVTEFILKYICLAILVFVFLFGLYVETDKYNIISQADSSKYKSYKPVSDDTLSFEQMKALNNDIIGWLTIDDTTIDYPIVQGKTNDTYINRTVFGEFSLTGSIFLDFRNKSDFTDTLSIVYGHNMIGNAMFGGIDLFREKAYFDSHRTGTLYCNGNYYDINIFACFRANGYDTNIYQPSLKSDRVHQWLGYVRENAIYIEDSVPENMPILLLSTCSSETTDGRTLLAASFKKGKPPAKIKEDDEAGFRIHIPSIHIDELNSTHLLIGITIWLLVTIIFTLLKGKGNKNDSQKREESK